MPGAEWLFDLSLGALLLVLAIASLHVRILYSGIIFFITFGLLLAITWARLGAPDLALAEAAIGSGLTGALLLSAFAVMGKRSDTVGWTLRGMLPATLLSGFLLVVLFRAVMPISDLEPYLPDLVTDQLEQSGVGHPVTAVLLNFRAWDTLLELLVLALALLGLRQLRFQRLVFPEPWALLQAWTRFLAPLSVLLGGYLLWRGSDFPGGAFQAGALFAAGAVVLRLNHWLPAISWRHWWVRAAVFLGAAIFLTVALILHWLGPGWLHYPQGWAKPLILLIEIAATLSIALTLTLLVVGETEELDG